MYKFEGFTKRANQALNYAIDFAKNLGHNYIGSEHILAGLLEAGSGIAYDVLAKQGLSLEKVEKTIKDIFGFGAKVDLSPSDLTPRCKNILETAVRHAHALNHGYVGSEHILLALMFENDSAAVSIMKNLGVSAELVLRDLESEFGKSLKRDHGSAEAKAGRAYDGSGSDGEADSNSNTPTLDKFGRDLTELAKKNLIDPVIGRQKEIDRVVQILSRRTKNNPVLIGEPGVGKTAIAEGLAIKIASGQAPETLRDKRLVSLDMTGMIAGTKYRGEFEERLKTAIDEVLAAGNVLLFIDEIHNLIGAGAAEGAVDAANTLKPYLARGEMQVVGATTLDEYRKHFEKDAALERRFQPVTVGEPTEEEAIEIMRGLRDKYEAHHKVKITDEAIIAAVKMSARYIGDRYLPDKAIDLVDEAASLVRLKKHTTPPDLLDLENKLKVINEEKQAAVNAQEFEQAAKLRDEEKDLSKHLEETRQRWKEENARASGQVGEQEIAQIVSSWTNIPVVQLTQEESERLLHMEEELHRRIVGQAEAVTAVSKAIRRGRVGLKDPKRPTGSFIFLGPTGVGKTELSKSLAEAMFGDEDAMIRMDMSEYMEKHTVSRMVGSPPGYVGYDEGGQLTEKVRRRPYSVLLFDEIEKAHPDVFNILLQILEDGILTDAQGRRVDFKNCIIIMTSNIGANLISKEVSTLGFADGGSNSHGDIKDAVMGELKKAFRPEFLNRVDDIIVFHRLSSENIEEIARRMLKNLAKRIGEMDIELSFDETVVKKVADEGFDPVYGARPLRRAIQSEIEDRLSEEMLEGKVQAGKKYVCKTVEDGLEFEEVE